MVGGFDARVGAENLPLLVDQVRDALGVSGADILAGSIGEAELSIGVAEQRKREVELLRKRCVLLGSVEARAEDRDILCCEFGGSVTEPLSLDRSTRGIGLRVEPEQHFLAPQATERDGRSIVRRNVKIGRFRSSLQHESPPIPDLPPIQGQHQEP